LVDRAAGLSPAGAGQVAREFIEGRRQPTVGWLVGGDVVVTTSEVLDKRVTGGEDPS